MQKVPVRDAKAGSDMEALLICSICLVAKAPTLFTKSQRLNNAANPRNGHCNACAFKMEGDTSDKSSHAKEKRKLNAVAVQQHRWSYQQQDGKSHKVRGQTTQARKLTRAAAEAAMVPYTDFSSRFQLVGCGATFTTFVDQERRHWSDGAAAQLTHHPPGAKPIPYAKLLAEFNVAVSHFAKLHRVEAHPTPWWTTPESLTDFITTFPRSQTRLGFVMKQTTKATHKHAVGAFVDSPLMSTHDLRFTSKLPGPRWLSVMPLERRLPRRPQGTVIFMDGVLVAGQAAGRVSLQGCALFIDAFNTLDRINGEYLMRGDDVANVNCNFVILGFKCDRYSRQGLLHSVAGMSNEDKTRHRETWNTVRKLFLDYVWPIAKDSFAVVLMPVVRWLEACGLELFVKMCTAVTGGDCFWPQAHEDPDIWFTILLCVHYGPNAHDVGGGDFAFTSAGWIFTCGPGDIFIYNPRYYHGTTEFSLPSSQDGKFFFACSS